ncbi:Ig-like domain-containing protein, partial [Sulfurimonas microaerophilic]|uniref:Ig-like domain-containing protein n=1 Tax=Sulfurimonas microaerophilic TaxID=3058392 RepID=UPI002714EAF9
MYEAGLPSGTDAPSNSEFITNAALTLGAGISVDTAQSGTSTYGTWSVATDGTFSYALTSAMNSGSVQGANTVNDADQFTYTAVDAYGNTVTNTVYINIVDDVPQVATDLGDVTEGHTLSVDAANGVLHNDVSGADGWASGGAVVGVVAGTASGDVSGQVGTTINGTYGTLTLNDDGSYTYESTANAVTADAQDVFTYTVKDGDGDLATTTLSIDVANVTVSPTDTTGTVYEAGLPSGTDAPSNSEFITNAALTLGAGISVDT